MHLCLQHLLLSYQHSDSNIWYWSWPKTSPILDTMPNKMFQSALRSIFIDKQTKNRETNREAEGEIILYIR